MNDFEYDSYIKKRIARGYQNKRNGSKSKKCSLPSDRLTSKEWKEKNGSVMSYQLNKPMEWYEFKNMPFDLQKRYIESLRDSYGVTATDLSKFMCVTPHTIARHCKDNLGIVFGAGKRMTKQQREMLSKFLGENDLADEPDVCCDDSRKEGKPTPEVPSRDNSGITLSSPGEICSELCTGLSFENNSRFDMKEISMSFTGQFDPDALRNSLLLSVGKGTPVRINISCSLLA